jgi:lipopolysaccharide heptosyltransferase II
MKLAVFLPNWIGDAVMATPALRAVRTEFPDAEIVAIHRPVVGDVLDGTGLVDRRLVWNPKGTDSSQRGWRFAAALRRERFDVALLLPNSLRSAWMAWLSGAKRRFGIARDGRRWLLTDRVEAKPKDEPHPVIDEYLRLAERLGCRTLSRRMELATLPADEMRLEQFWHTVGQAFQPDRGDAETSNGRGHSGQAGKPDLRGRYVCLNPGGAFGAAKHWPTESFAELARRIAVELHHNVLVLCGPAERAIARQIVALAKHPAVFSLADVPPSIGLTKAAVKSSELLVTTDSGPRHFAPPFDVPVVTLFGPTHMAWSETFYGKATHLQVPLDCGPCQQRVCPLQHHRCMTELSVDRVFAAAARWLTAACGLAVRESAKPQAGSAHSSAAHRVLTHHSKPHSSLSRSESR